MILLFSLFTFLTAGISTNPSASDGLLIVRADYGMTESYKTYMNFYQLDESNKLDLVDKVKMRNGVVLMPVKKINYDKPVVINYYMKNEGEIVNGDCHTLTLTRGGHYELHIILEEIETYLEVKQLTKHSDIKELELVKGIRFEN